MEIVLIITKQLGWVCRLLYTVPYYIIDKWCV